MDILGNLLEADQKRKRGRQKIGWDDDFEKLLTHKEYHGVAQDRKEWERLREAFAHNLSVYGPSVNEFGN